MGKEHLLSFSKALHFADFEDPRYHLLFKFTLQTVCLVDFTAGQTLPPRLFCYQRYYRFKSVV